MSTTVKYKGNTLTTVSNATKTLKTAGKYMEGDVILVDITDTPDFEELTVTPSDNTQVFTPYADAITYTVPSSTQLESNPMTGTVDLSFLTYGKQYKVTGMFYTRSHYRSSYSSDLVEFDTLWTASEDGEIAFNLSVLGDEHAHPIKITLSKTQIKVYYPDSITISRGAIANTSASRDITFAEKSCDAYSKVTVHAIPSQYIVPSGNLAITANGTGIDVTQYASVSVDVPTGSTINNQDKSVTPSESQQSITADSGYTGLGTVTVGAISSTYVGSEITQRSSTDLTVSGATVTAPAGYYSAAASKSVASGSASAPSSISGTSASVSTGTNTLTLTKTVSVTPVVSAGYVSSGTATNSSVSLTASVTTKAAATITPSTTNQTIAAGTYLTGAQTIAGDADLVGSNILSTANIFGVQGTVDFIDVYIRSAAPTSSVGSNGDIYIQE